MFCNSCGAELQEEAKFCHICGKTLSENGMRGETHSQAQFAKEHSEGKGLSVASFWCSLVGILMSWMWGLGMFPSAVGLILGAYAPPRQKLGQAGLILGIIAMVMNIALLILLIIVWGDEL